MIYARKQYRVTYTRKPSSSPLDAFARVVSPQRVGGVAGWVMLGLILVLTVMVVREQVALLPPRPPTPAERAAARPGAMRAWRVVAARLQTRFADKPLEVGEVWATRTGRVCGVADERKTNTDDMERFYTTPDLQPHMQDDDQYAFMGVWKACLDDRWVEIRAGSEQTGLCASARGRSSILARTHLCVGWTPE